MKILKITTTLHEILQADLINAGYNEFIQDGGLKLTFNDSTYSFLYKMRNNDEEVYKILNEKIFLGKTLDDPSNDKHFKQLFLNRFLSRQIGFQTVERFSMVVVSTFMEYEEFLNTIYSDLDSYINGESTTTSEGKSENIDKGNNIFDNRLATATLPQTKVNIDVDNSILDYADENRISRQREQRDNTKTNNDNSQTKTTTKNLDNLIRSRDILRRVLDQFDKRGFLHVW